MSPAKLQSLLQTGIGHHRAGRLAEAELLYRQARAMAPRNFDALHLSGLLAQQQNRFADSIALLEKALKMNPRAVVCELRLAKSLLALKRFADAEEHLRHALAVKCDFHEGWDQLALCLSAQDRLPEAIACHEKAVTLKPDFAAGWVNFGFTLRLVGRTTEALACHERALEAAPDYVPARFGRAQALQLLHRSHEAVAEYDALLALQPHSPEARSNRLFALQNVEGVTREQLFADHVAYGRSLGGHRAASFSNSPDPERRLRVAVFSPDLREHSCAYFLEPLLRHLDPDRFELYLYHDHFREDAVSARFRVFAAVWRNFNGQPSSAVEQTIRADAPDILIDLAGHTGMTNRLPVFARRVAPVQVNYLGYPDTTGVPAMDYRFTDAVADPFEDADGFATERLVRFAPTAWAYAPPSDAPEVGPPPCLARGYVTFGSFNDLAKITDGMIAIWSRILHAVSGSRLRLKGRGMGEAGTRSRLQERLCRAGIAAERVELLERTRDTRSHLALYNDVDMALDTFPYHGTTTTCEALWMGVPVVSLAGNRHLSRVGASLLSAAGHAEWSVPTSEAYVRLATELASDRQRLAAIRSGLRADLRGGPLLDHRAQARHFGEALRQCWTDWCARCACPATAGVE